MRNLLDSGSVHVLGEDVAARRVQIDVTFVEITAISGHAVIVRDLLRNKERFRERLGFLCQLLTAASSWSRRLTRLYLCGEWELNAVTVQATWNPNQNVVE